jgi:hypothetical protein
MIQVFDSSGNPIKGLFRDSLGVLHNRDDDAFTKYMLMQKAALSKQTEIDSLRKEVEELRAMFLNFQKSNV